MSKTYLTIELGGEKIGLKFNMGAYDVILAESGIESLYDKGTKDAAILIYAGMVGNSLAKDEEPDFTLQDVKKKVKKLDFDELLEVGTKVGEFVQKVYKKTQEEPVSGEGNGDTQSQKVLNVA